MANYPPDYPHSNELSDHSETAKKAFKSFGGIPLGTIKDDAGISEFYQDDTQGHADAAKDKTNNRAMKKSDAKTIGSKVFDGGQDPINFIKKFDPKNTSGSIPFALDLVKQIQSNSGPDKMLSDIVGQKLSEIMSKFTQSLKEEKSNEADELSKLIQLILELKRKLEQLLADPNADPQLINELQLQLAELEKKLESMSTV
jgi:hypothetical protein